MKFGLIRPCPSCPYRTDIRPFLTRSGAREIASAILAGKVFVCHQTTSDDGYDEDDEYTHTGEEHACAGALLVLERMGVLDRMGVGTHDALQLAERLGLFARDRLDRSVPVYDALDEWEAAQPLP